MSLEKSRADRLRRRIDDREAPRARPCFARRPPRGSCEICPGWRVASASRVAAAEGRDLYVEFPYSESEITPSLRLHVVPMLRTGKVSSKHRRRFGVGGPSECIYVQCQLDGRM